MDPHGISSGVSILELRQRENVEGLRSYVVVQKPAIRTTIDEPELVVCASHNSIQANFFGGSRGRIEFRICEVLRVESSETAADPLGQPAISLVIYRELVRFDIGFRELKFHSNVLCRVTGHECPGQAA